ncbi:WD40 repeat domain-containing protein [Helicobacter burdigaliensis]|uniref:WD40 repeat domain-containing protein n=1 Tax=Helicobacter burdigaliensis TaxID=2315334 RepID=UPI000EF70838|nr:nitrate reductase [Helicobacter burdigaliensis]
MKIVLVFIFMVGFLMGQSLEYRLELDENVTTLIEDNGVLLAGSDNGSIYAIKWEKDTQKFKASKIFQLEKIHNYFGENIYPKIFSLDVLDNQILILSQGDDGGKNLFIYGEKLIQIFSSKDSLNIKKAGFVDKKHLFLALASNEIMLYDLENKNNLYQKQISEASFSDFSLSEDRKEFIASCESGILYYGNTQNGEIIKTYEDANKDNVYQVKMAQNKLGEKVFVSAGQDRVVGIYTDKSSKKLQADFLVYSVGINKEATKIAYPFNENSDIRVYDLLEDKEVKRLKTHQNMLNNIIFLEEKWLVSAEDGKNIYFWNLGS